MFVYHVFHASQVRVPNHHYNVMGGPALDNLTQVRIPKSSNGLSTQDQVQH